MASVNPVRAWRAFLALPNDGLPKTLGMALLVSAACAVAVSLSQVALEGPREANLEAARRASLLDMLRSLPGMGEIVGAQQGARVEAVLVDLADGAVRPDDPGFDAEQAAAREGSSLAIPAEVDVARLGRREKLARIHLVRRAGRVELVVLPVRGRGYQSLLKGYLVVHGDLETIAGLTFYEQGETPGLGTRVTDAKWLEQFRGKKVFGRGGEVAIDIVASGASGPHQVDGISGATRTANGVRNLLRYWLGPHGFGPLLSRLREEL